MSKFFIELRSINGLWKRAVRCDTLDIVERVWYEALTDDQDPQNLRVVDENGNTIGYNDINGRIFLPKEPKINNNV